MWHYLGEHTLDADGDPELIEILTNLIMESRKMWAEKRIKREIEMGRYQSPWHPRVRPHTQQSPSWLTTVT